MHTEGTAVEGPPAAMAEVVATELLEEAEALVEQEVMEAREVQEALQGRMESAAKADLVLAEASGATAV
jgi:hypothetical protein